MGCSDSSLVIQTIVVSKGKIKTQKYDYSFMTRHQTKVVHINHPAQMGLIVLQNIKQNNFQITGNDIVLIQKALESHYLLYRLDKNERRQIINYMKGYTAESKTYIISEGDPGQLMLIVKQGTLKMLVNQVSIKQIGSSYIIQDRSLIFDVNRTQSYYTLTHCKFWGVSKSIYKKALQKICYKYSNHLKSFLKAIPLFNFLKNKQRQILTKRIFLLKFQTGQFIFNKGQNAHDFYIIVKGQIGLRIPNKQQIILRSGDSFGENALNLRLHRSGDAICLQNSLLISISRDAIEQSLENNYDFIIYYSIIKWSLRRHQPFSQMVGSVINKIIQSGKIKTYSDGQIICEKGTKYANLYVCLQGKINDQGVGTVFNRDFDHCQRELNQSLVKHEKGAVFQINFHKLNYILGNNLNSRLFYRDNKLLVSGVFQKSVNQISFQNLFYIKDIKENEYEKIFLVHNYGQILNLRMINKNMIIKYEHEKFVIQEKRVWKMLSSSLQVEFLNSLRKTYLDQNFIYFLYNYEQYGCFRAFMNQIKTFSSEYTKFYIGCLILGIQQIHQYHIIHRDIRPENLYIDRRGFLMIGNFNYSKQLKSGRDRTFTMIGSPQYSAPQIPQLLGYGLSADLWSVGIIMYEMVVGKLPYTNFFIKTFDHPKHNAKEEIYFPEQYKNEAGKKLIKKLLTKNQDQRQKYKIELIKSCQFFKGFNWDSLSKKLSRPPTYPKVESYRQMKKIKHVQVIKQIQKTRLKIGQLLKSQRYPNWEQDFRQ